MANSDHAENTEAIQRGRPTRQERTVLPRIQLFRGDGYPPQLDWHSLSATAGPPGDKLWLAEAQSRKARLR